MFQLIDFRPFLGTLFQKNNIRSLRINMATIILSSYMWFISLQQPRKCVCFFYLCILLEDNFAKHFFKKITLYQKILRKNISGFKIQILKTFYEMAFSSGKRHAIPLATSYTIRRNLIDRGPVGGSPKWDGQNFFSA